MECNKYKSHHLKRIFYETFEYSTTLNNLPHCIIIIYACKIVQEVANWDNIVYISPYSQ